MTRLDQAQCLTYTGKISDGLQYATDTITSLTESRRQGIITLRAQEITRELPDRERKSALARDLDELLALTAGKDKAGS